MKHLLAALFLLFPFGASGQEWQFADRRNPAEPPRQEDLELLYGDTLQEWQFSDWIDVVGTPLQEDFKLLYREAQLAQTWEVGEFEITKPLSVAGRDRAKSIIEEKGPHLSFIPCEMFFVDDYLYVGRKSINKDMVSVPFLCSNNVFPNLKMFLELTLGRSPSTYKYFVRITKLHRPANSIWDD